ncbi:piggyBac transposable element-derived protein 4-like isoform X1 [Temnothorax longispinosus]|uniref:piggyBac transposable element-derived protein 4-like isoform X1 n=1 Tax=Temnothorax longispinosus TaxID=300112 RepID=UPI003A9999B2
MAQRQAEEVGRSLCLREPVSYFGDRDSDEELDSLEEQEDSNTEEEADKFEFEERDESEQDSEEKTTELEGSTSTTRKCQIVYGKDKYPWFLSLPKTRNRSRQMHLPGAMNHAIIANSPLECWSTLFSDNLLEVILKYTNIEIDKYHTEHDTANEPYQKHLGMVELKAFFGLLYFAGLKNDNRINIAELWSYEFGSSIYRATMNVRRFEFIADRIRFDDKTTRAERKQTDGLAAVREIWDIFINNCQTNYTPSEFLTVDELLLGYRGRFSSKVYIKSKPDRYGIKIITLNDAKTHYLYNAIPYAGSVNPPANETIPSYYIRKICEPIYHSNRNITCDNWFSSVEIFNQMYKDYNLTMVGTIRKNKRQIPKNFKSTASVGTVRCGYDGTNVLMSWCPKKNKVVLILSSLHKSCKISKDSGKPELVDFYNSTKAGTDVFNQCCALHTCARKTNRWTMRFFLGMLDQASVNSHILYNFNVLHKIENRRSFLKELSLSLITPHLHKRKNTNGLHISVIRDINNILSETDIPDVDKNDKLQIRKRCSVCEYNRNKKTLYCCSKCKKPLCEDHRVRYCYDCAM